MRKTLAKAVHIEGIALHEGIPVYMTLQPAVSGSGIVFCRADSQILALYDRVSQTRLGTVIQNKAGVTVSVIEHLMAALSGAEIDDASITLDGPELPILDGSALVYFQRIHEAGILESAGHREEIHVRRAVEVGEAGASAALLPGAERRFEFDIDFGSPAIGRQTLSWTFSPGGFEKEIAPARTFGLVHELDALHEAGLARGASLENTLAVDGDHVVNADLMRFPDEFVRHKILDAIGDLALAGAPIVARFIGHRSGHALNNQLMRKLFSDSANYERVTLE